MGSTSLRWSGLSKINAYARLNSTVPHWSRRQILRAWVAMRQQSGFTPLDVKPESTESSSSIRLKGVVFDMDGTLCEPQNYMFKEMRAAVGIDQATDILDHIYALPEREQTEAFARIQEIEHRAMRNQVPQAGLVTLMEYLDRHGILKAICTRNFDAPVNHLLQNHLPGHLNAFSPIITRDFRPPKPSPAGILHIARAWDIADAADTVTTMAPRSLPLIMVGDSEDDMEAGREAGALTVLLRSAGKENIEFDDRTDFAINRLDELIGLLEAGLRPRTQTDH